jgi:hypothetical protein
MTGRLVRVRVALTGAKDRDELTRGRSRRAAKTRGTSEILLFGRNPRLLLDSSAGIIITLS